MITAKKSLGQHFLSNPRILEKIVRCAILSGSEHVIEIGPGTGNLTEILLRHAREVIALEKDPRCIQALRERFNRELTDAHLKIIQGDCLKFVPPITPYILIGNIPYNITSPIIDHFIGRKSTARPLFSVLLVQLEVAEKICAQPPRMNILALHTQAFAQPKIAFHVGRKNFAPIPRIDSAVITLQKRSEPLKLPFDLIHRAFTHKRKMLRSTLGAAVCTTAGIDPQRRPETLSIEEWSKLSALVPFYRAIPDKRSSRSFKAS